ncbi:hypothetical protein N7505_004414 [Penicillium chrysogenum]|uniref:Uncharacterized protein n=1 Tax=Penicillium chrysogenum TaxID=5076 RepID=A0ABQ8WFB4_PENCH|nr:hypothetical protein N7505_004414 [Penicillium chrysogenum]
MSELALEFDIPS